MSCNAEHPYKLTMSNGVEAECDSLVALLRCVEQQKEDDPTAQPVRVYCDRVPVLWATTACIRHLKEVAAGST